MSESGETQQNIPSVLACDCGNTHLAIAHVKGEQVSGEQVFRLGELADLGEALLALWNSMPEPKRIVASSVNPSALKALEAAAAEQVKVEVLVIGRDLPLPLPTHLDKPEAIGTDRLCAAVAAYDRLGVACVVGDFGTAITLDCVDGEGVFCGGAILPGLRLSADALANQTALLPTIDLPDAPPDWVFGGDTRQAIVGGLIYGARGALRELVEQYATHLGSWPVVILTGGDADRICPEPGRDGLVQAIVADLTLRGVAIGFYRSLLP
jgi:type III pantothenate kinase